MCCSLCSSFCYKIEEPQRIDNSLRPPEMRLAESENFASPPACIVESSATEQSEDSDTDQGAGNGSRARKRCPDESIQPSDTPSATNKPGRDADIPADVAITHVNRLDIAQIHRQCFGLRGRAGWLHNDRSVSALERLDMFDLKGTTPKTLTLANFPSLLWSLPIVVSVSLSRRIYFTCATPPVSC